jgi:hypothetical protein
MSRSGPDAAMREVLATRKELVRRLDEMEGTYDRQFKVVFDAIRALMEPPTIPRRRIGYGRPPPEIDARTGTFLRTPAEPGQT